MKPEGSHFCSTWTRLAELCPGGMEAADVAFDLSTQILEKIMDLLTEDGAEEGFLRAGIAKSQERVLMF